MSLAMSKEQREEFLAAVRVGVLSIPDPGRGPLTVPIWYAYQPGGDLHVVTDRGSRKGRLLEKAERVSLCVQTETPPYQYVSVEGPVVSIEPSDLEEHLRPMAHRYLGSELGDAYVKASEAERSQGSSVVVTLRPERWLSVDYHKQFADA